MASTWDQVMGQLLHARWDLQIMEPKRMPVWIHTQLRADPGFLLVIALLGRGGRQTLHVSG
jgi:hypothetical protein